MTTFEREILERTPEDLARINGAPLLARQPQTLARKHLDAVALHDAEMRQARAIRDGNQRIGREVRRLSRQGRKTARIDALMALAKEAAQ